MRSPGLVFFHRFLHFKRHLHLGIRNRDEPDSGITFYPQRAINQSYFEHAHA